jgi:hypothetical protein
MKKIRLLNTKLKNSEDHQAAVDSLNEADAYVLITKDKSTEKMTLSVVGMNQGSAIYCLEKAKLEILRPHEE